MAKILLLSAYDAASHRCWRQQLAAQFPEHQWTQLSLPARYFSWRIRGNSLSWAFSQQQLSQHYDLVIATSMVDLSALRGFIPSLGQIPTLVYFHENQFAYPASQQQFSSIEPQMVNLYTALCADKVVFNSSFNRDSFLQGVQRLLKKLPDQVPTGLVERLTERSDVLAVPLVRTEAAPDQATEVHCDWRVSTAPVLKIAWAARWEYDKGPDRLLAIVEALEARGLDYRLCLLGQQFRQVPAAFQPLQRDYSHRLVQFGFVESSLDYQGWLSSADVILSTAIHEFQGLAVLEAIAAGCVPLLPAREVYPELVATEYLYPSCLQDIGAEAAGAAEQLCRYHQQLPALPDIGRYGWAQLRPRYRQHIESLLSTAY